MFTFLQLTPRPAASNIKSCCVISDGPIPRKFFNKEKKWKILWKIKKRFFLSVKYLTFLNLFKDGKKLAGSTTFKYLQNFREIKE